MCGAHATVRGLLGEIVSTSQTERDVIVDMEAGLEHLSRGTGRHVSRFLAVVEPYFRSMETARRVAQLAADVGITDVVAVANKIRNDADRAEVRRFCATHGLDIAAEVPYDSALLDAERAAKPPIDFAPDAPAIKSIENLAHQLRSTAAGRPPS